MLVDGCIFEKAKEKKKACSRIKQIVQDRVKMERMYACKDEKKQMGTREKDSSTHMLR